MQTTVCKTNTSCESKLCLLARWQWSGMERVVACWEEHYVMYYHIHKEAQETCTSTRTIFKANNLCLVLLFGDLLSLSHFLGQGFLAWVCLSYHTQFWRSCSIVFLSLHIENSWDLPSQVHVWTCMKKQLGQCDESVYTTAPCFVFLLSLPAIRLIKYRVFDPNWLCKILTTRISFRVCACSQQSYRGHFSASLSQWQISLNVVSLVTGTLWT